MANFSHDIYKSFQDIRYTKNAQNKFLTPIFRGTWFELFPNTYAKNI